MDDGFDASGLIAKAEQVRAQVQAAKEAELRQELAMVIAAEQAPPLSEQGALPAPPGFVGRLAQFVYQQAPRPVPEVAIVAALGLMAGICGRGWSISGTGLNLYVVLVARSAIGKEAMSDGIAMMISAASVSCSQVGDAFDFSDYASGPALTKACSQNPCFVNVASEIGHKFLAMATDREPAMRSYRRTLTDLYSKSGPNGIASGISYSNQEANVASMKGVAFSLIGETTPANFYESITPAMMNDGFMSRFCVIEYTGERPDENRTRLQVPPPDLVTRLNVIFQQGCMFSSRDTFMPVALHDDARELLDRFSTECDHAIRAAGDDEGMRQLWNRAHLKALRVSGLLAVGENPFEPVITVEQATWAIALIHHGIDAFAKRIRSGDVGEGTDGGREQKVLDICRKFLALTPDKMPHWLKYGDKMREALVIPRRYIQQQTQRVAAFEKHKLGHTQALNMAIKTAMANGNLMEVKKLDMDEQFNFNGEGVRYIGRE